MGKRVKNLNPAQNDNIYMFLIKNNLQIKFIG